MRSFEATHSVRLLTTEDGALIIDLQTDIYYSLNRTGLETWNVLIAGGTVEEAAGSLARAFGVPSGPALTFVQCFVETAMGASLMVERSSH